MYNYPYLLNKTFLQEFNKEKCKQQHLKVNILNWKEQPIQQVSGLVISGNINMDASSAMRRTGNITFFASQETSDITNINNLFSINKKIEIEIGYSNTTEQYTEYPIIWFPQGIFLIKDASISHGLDGLKISLTLHDKMALLNGECGGTLPAATIFHEMEQVDSYGNVTISKPTIVQIIQELVHHFGGEQAGKIIIKDLQPIIKQVLKWNGTDDRNLYVYNQKANSLLYDVLKEDPDLKNLLNNYNKIDDLKNKLKQIDKIEIISKKQREILKKWETSLTELKDKLNSLNFSTIDDVQTKIKEFYYLIMATKSFCNYELQLKDDFYKTELTQLPCFNIFGIVDEVLAYAKQLKINYSRIKNLISSKLKESDELPYWETETWDSNNEKQTLSLPINEPVLLQTIFALPDINYGTEDFYNENFAKNYNCGDKNNLEYKLPYQKISIKQKSLDNKTAKGTHFISDNKSINAIDINKRNWNVRSFSLVILQNSNISYDSGSFPYHFPFADFIKIRKFFLKKDDNDHLANFNVQYKIPIMNAEKRICSTLKKMLTGIKQKTGKHYVYSKNDKGNWIYDQNSQEFIQVPYQETKWNYIQYQDLFNGKYYRITKNDSVISGPNFPNFATEEQVQKRIAELKDEEKKSLQRYERKEEIINFYLKKQDQIIKDDEKKPIPIYDYPYAKKADFLSLIDDFILWTDTIINYLQVLKKHENDYITKIKSIQDVYLSNNIINKDKNSQLQKRWEGFLSKNGLTNIKTSLESFSYSAFLNKKIQQLQTIINNLPQQFFNNNKIIHLKNNYNKMLNDMLDNKKYLKDININILNCFENIDVTNFLIYSDDKYVLQDITKQNVNIIKDFLSSFSDKNVKTFRAQLTNKLNQLTKKEGPFQKTIDKIEKDKEKYKNFLQQTNDCQKKLNNEIIKVSNQIINIKEFQQKSIKSIASDLYQFLNNKIGYEDSIFNKLSKLITLTEDNQYNIKIDAAITTSNEENLFLNENNKIFSSLNQKIINIENLLSNLESIIQIDLVEPENLNFSSLDDCLNYYKKLFTTTLYQQDDNLFTDIKQTNIFNNIKIFKPGQDIGYTLTKFVYPGQLTAEAGQTVVSVLDKIKNTLGNFEYFYDVNGNFIFQEIKNYLNKSYSSYILAQNTSPSYDFNIVDGKSVYNFENNEIIQSYSSNPQFSAIKNNFIVWGERKSPDGKKYPIRYHLAIDNKPEVKSRYKFQKLPTSNNLDANINYHYKSDFPKEGQQFKYYYAHYENKFYRWMIEKNSTFFGYKEAVPPSSEDTLFFSSQKDMQKFLNKKKNDLILQIKNISTSKKLTHEYYVKTIFSLKNGFQQKNPSTENGKPAAILIKHIFIQNENKYYKVKFSIPLQNDLSNNIQDNVNYQLIQTFSTFFGNIIITNDNDKESFKSNDYRMELFLNGIINSNLGNNTPEYYTELATEWPKLYNIFPQNKKQQPDFYEDIKKNPTNIDYFLDILSNSDLVTKYGISNIGKRTVIIKNNNINCIFEPVCPNVIYIDEDPQININQSVEDQERQKEKIKRQRNELEHNINIWNNKNYFSSFDTIIEIEHEVYKQMVNGGAARSAYEEIRAALYQYITYNEQLSLTLLPVYNLQPNQIITVNNEQAHISGDFLIKSISFSLGSDSIMNLSCSKVIQRI